MEPDVMIHPDYMPILKTDELVSAIPSFDWKGGHSGRLLEPEFAEKLEALAKAIGYHVAAGHIDRDLLTDVMRSIVDDEDYSEATKLDLIAAMSQGL